MVESTRLTILNAGGAGAVTKVMGAVFVDDAVPSTFVARITREYVVPAVSPVKVVLNVCRSVMTAVVGVTGLPFKVKVYVKAPLDVQAILTESPTVPTAVAEPIVAGVGGRLMTSDVETAFTVLFVASAVIITLANVFAVLIYEDGSPENVAELAVVAEGVKATVTPSIVVHVYV